MTSTASENAVTALKGFLTSSATNVERLPDSLRSQLSIATGLESVISAAIKRKRSVVIAGTAGSGKTHLLKGLDIPAKSYEIVSDLSALPEKKWNNLLRGPRPTIIAGNEGAFVMARSKNYAGFAEVLDLLHMAQQSQDTPHRSKAPIIVDAAGYDPAGQKAISLLVRLPILRDYIRATKPELHCLTWDLFQEPAVCDRLAMCVEAASAESDADGFTFRQLWQFIADLIEGPREGETWIDRTFSGDTEVSRRISTACDPRRFSLPGISSHLWYGDLLHLKSNFLPGAIPVLEQVLQFKPADVQISDWQKRLRAIALLGLKSSPLDTYFSRGADLWSEVRSGRHIGLIRQINRYFCYGLLDLSSDLELWLQHDTERRVSKSNTQGSLGSVPANHFSLVKSRVIANKTDEMSQLPGSRIMLRHNDSGSSLHITKDLVDAILKTRSHRTLERRDVEYDWRLSKFFDSIAKTTSRVDRLKVASFNFQVRRARLLSWDVGGVVSKVD